jgi:hypothetical protein
MATLESNAFAVLSKKGELFTMLADASTSGSNGIHSLTVSDVNLQGSCLMSGVENGMLYLISSEDNGVFQLNCDMSSYACESTLVASIDSDIGDIKSCSLSQYSSNSGGVVIAASSSAGYFVSNIPTSSSSSSSRMESVGKMSALTQVNRKYKGNALKSFEKSLLKNLLLRDTDEAKENEGLMTTQTDDVMPPSFNSAIDAIAVISGFNKNGGGLALAFSTKDHMWYTTSLDDEIPTTGEIVNSLEWRDEWITSPDWYGGAVDFRIPRYGLHYQLQGEGKVS